MGFLPRDSCLGALASGLLPRGSYLGALTSGLLPACAGKNLPRPVREICCATFPHCASKPHQDLSNAPLSYPPLQELVACFFIRQYLVCDVLPGLRELRFQAVFFSAAYCLDWGKSDFRQYFFLRCTAWTGGNLISGSNHLCGVLPGLGKVRFQAVITSAAYCLEEENREFRQYLLLFLSEKRPSPVER